jgi:multidrug resistance efflux pump
VGQAIAKLDSSALQQQAAILMRQVELEKLRLNRLRAGSRTEEIERAQALVAREEAASTRASADYSRSHELYQKGVIPRAKLDAAASQMQQASASLDEAQAQLALVQAGTRKEDLAIAQAQLDSALAELEQVQWEISQCVLRAPVAGVVLEQFAQPGDWLTPGTDNPRSGAVLSLFNPSRIQAWVDINQRDSAAISIGQRVELTTDAYPERKVQGSVYRIMPQANLQKNTVQVKIAIDDPPADFRPELSVKIAFLPDEEAESPAGADASTVAPEV